MSDPQSETSFGGCFLSAFRNLAGPGVLLAMCGVLVVDRPPLGSGLDLAFIAVALVNVVVGLLYKPQDTAPKEGTGEVKGLSRGAFVGMIVAVSAVVWALAHFVLRR